MNFDHVRHEKGGKKGIKRDFTGFGRRREVQRTVPARGDQRKGENFVKKMGKEEGHIKSLLSGV